MTVKNEHTAHRGYMLILTKVAIKTNWYIKQITFYFYLINLEFSLLDNNCGLCMVIRNK